MHTGNFPPGIFTEHIPEDSFFRYKPAGIIPGGVGTVRHVSVSRNVSNLGKPGTGRRQIGNSKMEVKQQRQHCGTCKKRKPSEIPDHPRPIRGRCPYYEEWQAIKDSRSTRGPSPHPTVVTSMQSAVTGTSPQQQQQQQQQVAQVADPELELPIKVPWEQIGETGMHLNDAHAPVRTCAPLRAHINTHTCMYAVDMSRALYKCDHLLTWTSRHVRRTDTERAGHA